MHNRMNTNAPSFGEMFPYLFTAMNNNSFTCELKFVMKHRHGYLDYIHGECTSAARRYLRSNKRWKEKQRRQKLKGAI